MSIGVEHCIKAHKNIWKITEYEQITSCAIYFFFCIPLTFCAPLQKDLFFWFLFNFILYWVRWCERMKGEKKKKMTRLDWYLLEFLNLFNFMFFVSLIIICWNLAHASVHRFIIFLFSFYFFIVVVVVVIFFSLGFLSSFLTHSVLYLPFFVINSGGILWSRHFSFYSWIFY